jgi:DNA polymerase-3 subunit gamma/tau
MSYQVLARKWRPGTFADLVGQEHVVRALVNALERGQLHHAYLFTGTRGVGKTTLARILAKTLNCEQGVGATPCGTCASCTEIDEGRFVDLIEVDAASRTKVDQTRELLDNVPFAPVRGRYKVYLIDEVHMFSASSFNALLKTLEEPPEHVKFVLATTDPQKLPATVLSRCLQFNLKRLLPEQIAERFRYVLSAESVAFEDQALLLLARAADGSMRDGLSLLDQAIAFGGGSVTAEDTRAMLGTRAGDLSLDLLDALAGADAARALVEVGRIAELTPDFAGVLKDLIALLHDLALAQQVPATLADDDPDRERMLALAARVPPEDLQLYYQILLAGQHELALAPDPRTGLEMLLLRALAFRPEPLEPQTAAPAPGNNAPVAGAAPGSGSGSGSRAAGDGASAAGSRQAPPGVGAGGTARRTDAAPAGPAAAVRRALDGPASAPLPSADTLPGDEVPPDDQARAPARQPAPAAVPVPPDSAPESAPGSALDNAGDWLSLVGRLDLGGFAKELANHCAFVEWDGKRLRLALDPALSNLRVAGAEQRLGAALAAAMGREVALEIETGHPPAETPARRRARDDAARQAEAETLLRDDALARELQSRLDAQWVPDSIRPAD